MPKKKVEHNIIAILLDCDDTLCDDSTTFLLKECGIDDTKFWDEINKMVRRGWDPPLAYMSKLIEMTQARQIELTKDKFEAVGSKLTFYPGVPEVFGMLRDFVNSKEEFQDAGVSMEFYVITSGFEEMLKKSKIAPPTVNDIFGCNFDYDRQGQIKFIKSTVTFTEKTKFVFAINKGISGSDLRRQPSRVNETIDEDDRRIPFENMVYIGDGPTDIPCFSVIQKGEGSTIGVEKKAKSSKKIWELITGKRTTMGPYNADYSQNGELYSWLERLVGILAEKIVARKQERFI